MSKNEATVSGAEHDEQNTDSVYDYLYYDARRVGSFLAQFDPSGHLQQITQTDSVSKGAKRGYSVKLGGSVPVPGSPEAAEGSLTFGREPGQTGSEGMARLYDPLWTNAKLLLDYLDERNLIKRDLAAATMGQFVLATGEISVLDLATVADFWQKPSIKRLSVNTQAARSKGQSSPPGTVEFAMDTISTLPHGLQMTMTSSGRKIWGSLRADSLTGSASDLLLKHGAKIAGTWSILGILDAKPDNGASMQVPDIGGRVATDGFTVILEALGPIARLLLGRPNQAFGATPLLIFREVGN